MTNRKLVKKLFATVLTVALVGGVLTPFTNAYAADEGSIVAPPPLLPPPEKPVYPEEPAEPDKPVYDPVEPEKPTEPVYPAEPAIPVKVEELQGDLLVGDNTEKDKVYETTKDAEVDFTGALYVSAVKEQMRAVEKAYPLVSENMFSMIRLSDVKSEFVATLALPDEMEFVNLQGALAEEGAFEVTEVTADVANKTAAVKMQLKNAASITNYKMLRDAVMGMPDVLKVVVRGVKFTTAAQPDTNYTVLGRVKGMMKATATLYQNQIPFEFSWEGVQHPDGKDVTAPNDQIIQFTLKYVEKAPQPQPQPEPDVTPTPKDDKQSAAEAKKVTEKMGAKNKATAPKTGDRANIPLYGGLVVVSILAVGGIVAVKKKRR